MADTIEITYDLIVVGGGPAGLAAAISAKQNGLKKVLVLERDSRAGGILLQCIHNGFGLHYFGEVLTGPEYAGRFVKQSQELNIETKVNTMVLEIHKGNPIHEVVAINSTDGLMCLKTKTIALAMGCRERTRGALVIPGTRPAGIFTAGSAQRFVNIDGYLPEKKIVILGSGDIGLIMARRLTLEGAEVKLVCELMPFSAGLKRNIVQCLENFGIPLKLSTTVTEIRGRDRVEGVTIAKVDANRKPVPGTEQFIECDTLLLSVGLIPENEVSAGAGVRMDPVTKGPSVNQLMETSVPGIFACGNTVHVHDLVDFVTTESMLAGQCAAAFAAKTISEAEQKSETRAVAVNPGIRVRYTVPQHIDLGTGISAEDAKVQIMFRSTDVYRGVTVNVYSGDKKLYTKKARIVRPGEMQIAEIPETSLADVKDPLTVSIETPEDTID